MPAKKKVAKKMTSRQMKKTKGGVGVAADPQSALARRGKRIADA